MPTVKASPDEVEEIWAALVLRPFFAEACISCAVIGVLLFMCIYGLNVYLETPKELRQGRRRYIVISFIILILHCFSELPSTYLIFQLLYKTSNYKEGRIYQTELNSTWWTIAAGWASAVLVWVGDGLLVYRCHIVWTGRPLVSVLTTTVYLGSVGLSIFLMATVASTPEANNVTAAWFFLSAGVNCLTTFLISFRLLHMRKQQAAVMAPVDSKVYLGIVSILVESALPLSLAGILVASTSWANTKPVLILSNTALLLWYNLCALAPSLIIFRVAVGRSWENSTRKASHLSTLAFQRQTFHLSGEMRETSTELAAPDLEKNEMGSTIPSQPTAPNLDLTKGASDLHPQLRRRQSF